MLTLTLREGMSGLYSKTFSPMLGFRLITKMDIRIVPASMLIYLLCLLDPSNVVSLTIAPKWYAAAEIA
jgi:hypothetical protein